VVEVIHPQVLKMTFAPQQVVADDQQSMADSYDRPLPPAVGCDSLKVGRKVGARQPLQPHAAALNDTGATVRSTSPDPRTVSWFVVPEGHEKLS